MAYYIWVGVGLLSALGLFGISLALAIQKAPAQASTGFKAALGEIYFFAVCFPALIVPIFRPEYGGMNLGLFLSVLCLVEFPRGKPARIRFSLLRLLLCSILLAATIGWIFHLVNA